MKNVLEWIKEKYKQLEGKKRNIGILIYLVGLGLEAFFPELMTEEQTLFIQATGGVIGGYGWVDSLARSRQGQEFIKKINLKKK